MFKNDLIPCNVGNLIQDSWNMYDSIYSDVDELVGFQTLEIRSSLPDELLLYADKLSMAHSLEIRVPYLDKEIVEYVETLPSSFKIHGLNQKWIHRKICEQYLPRDVIKRKKLGFEPPIAQWMRESVAGKIKNNLLDNASRLYAYLSYANVSNFMINLKH
jgi:asparagine synthase (glutamine-hydrolysing)